MYISLRTSVLIPKFLLFRKTFPTSSPRMLLQVVKRLSVFNIQIFQLI